MNERLTVGAVILGVLFICGGITNCRSAEVVMGSFSFYDTTGVTDSQQDTMIFTEGVKFTHGHRCTKYLMLDETPKTCIAPDGVSTVELTENADLKRAFQDPDMYFGTCCVEVAPDSDKEWLAVVRRNLIFLYDYQPSVRWAITGGIILGLLIGLAVVASLVLHALMWFFGVKLPEEPPPEPT